MAEQREFQYAPGFLARRIPLIAELEDNPIFLREIGKRYRSHRSKWDRLRSKIQQVGSGIALTFGIFFLIACCFVLLVFISPLSYDLVVGW